MEIEKTVDLENIESNKTKNLENRAEKTENDDNWIINIVQFTDPYCTWCWGSEPIMRKIQALYGDQVKISFVMGGLAEDIDTFYDAHNNIGGPQLFEQGAAHWTEASGRHGQPVEVKVMQDMKKSLQSSFQANIGYKAAQMQNQKLADKFLRRMREAAAAERRLIHKMEVQMELAEEIGLDKEAYFQAIESGEAEKKFREDLKFTRSYGIHGFPTFQVKNRSGESKFLNGWQKFETFENVMNDFSNNTLKREPYNRKEEDIMKFIKRFGKVSTQEVATLLDIYRPDAYKYLKNLQKLTSMAAGNDFFWFVQE